MYTKIKKRLAIVLSAICAFAVAFGLYGILTNETGAITSSAETYTETSDASSFSASGAYKLTDNIEVSSIIIIPNGADVVIDLNGKTISVANGYYTNAIEVASGATLTINDNAGSGAVTGYYNAIYNLGTLTVNGGTLTGTTTNGIYNYQGEVIVNDGVIKGNNDGDNTYNGIYTYNGKVTINNGTLTGGNCGICNYDGSTITVNGGNIVGTAYNGIESYSGMITINGGYIVGNTYNGIYVDDGYGNASTININGGTIVGVQAGLIYFGKNDAETPTVINITGGTITGNSTFGIAGNGSYPYSSVTISGGTIEGGATAYYHPEDGDLTITGGTFTGVDCALEIRAGSLTITGGTFTATYSGDSAGATANNSGTTVVGASIGISQHTTNLDLSVNITGGTFSGYYAVYETDTVTNSKTDNISVSLTGGTYETTNTADNATAVASTTKNSTTDGDNTTSTSVLSVTGGTYNTDVSTYIASGLKTTSTTTTTDGVATTTYSITVNTSVIANTENYSVLMSYDGSAVTAYESFSSALEAAKSANSISIWLYGNVTECISIPAGLTVTLDLCGYTITNKVTTTEADGTTTTTSDHTITVASGATLTINDTSSEGTGTVDNITHARGALVNYGTTILNGGTFTRSKEAGDKKTSDGGNSYYTIDNYQGTLIINDGVTVTTRLVDDDENAVGTYSSLIRNLGSSSGAGGILTINGGTFIGGLNTVKNDDYGTLTITGGDFSNTYQNVIMNWNAATITGGTFTVSNSGSAVIWVGYWNADVSADVSLTITGGTFDTEVDGASVVTVSGYYSNEIVTVELDGGTYNGAIDTGSAGTFTITSGTYNGAITTSGSTVSITGGTYSEKAAASVKTLIEENKVEANLVLTSDGEGNYTANLYDVKLVSDNTTTGYTDGETTALEQALAAIGSTAGTYTIILGKDYTLSSALTIASDQNVTLDLNGYTLTITGYDTAFNTNYANVINNGTLTIIDSVGTGELNVSTVIIGLYNAGTLNLNGGTIVGEWLYNDTTSNSYAIYNGGIIAVNGGNVNSNYFGIYNSSSGTVTVEDGTISGVFGIYNYGTVEVEDGTIYGSSVGINNYGTVAINGGEITGDAYNGIQNYNTLTVNDGKIIGNTYDGIYNNGTVTINGGEISGTYGVENYATMTITGGTIVSSQYSKNGSAGTLNITGGTLTGKWVLVNYGELNISGDDTVIAGVIDGVESYSGTVTITGGSITGAYYGVYVTGTSSSAIIGGTATVTATGEGLESTSAKGVWIYGVYIDEATVTIEDSATITADGDSTKYVYGAGIVYWGNNNESMPVTIVISGGTIYGSTYGISGNGSYSYSDVTITGGDITGGVVGYYHPEDGTLIITGGSITGYSSGLQACAGTITITGGTFTATATAAEIAADSNNTSSKTGDGIIADGAAISIINRNGYGISQNSENSTTSSFSSNSITITGGTFTSASGVESVQAYSYNSKISDESKVSALETEGSDAQTIIAVTGGTFSSGLTGTYSSYLAAEGLTTSYDSESGTYGIVVDTSYTEKTYVAYLNGAGYETLSAAILAAAMDGTLSSIILYSNLTEDLTVKNGQNIILLLNGYTLTSAITLESGSVLSISGGTVSGSITASGATLTITGGTIEATITANSSATVTITDGTINGDITADSATVEISGGTYTGTLSGTDYSITGGTFTILPDTSYFASGYCAYQQLDGTYLTVSGNFVAIPTLTTTTYVYTGSSPALSELEGAGYAVSIDGYIVGTHAVTLTLNSGYVWSDGTIANKTLYITITAADMVVSASGYNDTYDGSAHGGSVSVTTPTNATIEYGTEEGSYTMTTAPTYTTVGTYTVYYKITADNYNDATGSYTITITAATMTATVTGYSGTYDGSAHGATTVTIADGATIVYGEIEGTYSETAPTYTAAGEYTVYYQITKDNYQTITGSYTVTIEKATYDMGGVKLEDTTVTYNGSEQSIKITGKLPTGVMVSYSGSGTMVGTYTITATFTGNSNYNDITSLTATLTITKQTVAAPTEDSTTYTYNGKAQTYGIATNDLYTISGATQTNAGTYTVTVDLVDHDNYVFDSGKTMLTYTFTIAKATVDVPEASTKDYTYNGSEQTYDIAESSLYTINGATHTNAGTYTVTVALVDYDNYVWSDSTVTAYTYTFIIEKANNAISVSISGWTYGQSANAPVATVTGESGTIVFGYSTAIDGDYTATAPMAAGTYYVMAYIAATTNYNAAYSTPVAFTIAKATYDMSGITLADLTVTYDGTAQSILISGTLTAGVTVTYTGNGNTEAGTYTITAAFAGDSANYEAIASLTATLTISKAAITATAEGYSGTYDGGAHSGSIATISGATIAYGTSEGTYDLAEAPAYTSAGTYTVYYQISKENYETLTGSYTVTITAATVEVSEENTVVGTVTSDTLTVEVTANINLVEEESYDLATETIVETVVAAIEEVESAEVVAVYDITLTTASGEGITVADATDSGKIAVTVAIPTALASKDFYIVHIHDGEIIGIITSDEYEKINGSVTFEVSSLSQFAFVETSTETTTQSSNNFETYLMIGLVVGDLIAVLLIVVVVCMVIRRKRTA